jgi:hypothetical protein
MAASQIARVRDAQRQAALCSLGVELIRFKFANVATARPDAVDMLSAALSWKNLNLGLTAAERVTVARQAVHEWAIDLCPVCKGAGETPSHADVEGQQPMQHCILVPWVGQAPLHRRRAHRDHGRGIRHGHERSPRADRARRGSCRGPGQATAGAVVSRAQKYGDAAEAHIFKAILEPMLPITPAMGRAVAECESPCAVLYYLRANPDIAKRISKMRPVGQVQVIRAIGAAWRRADRKIRVDAGADPRPRDYDCFEEYMLAHARGVAAFEMKSSR